jgi:hypothetical protein
MQKFFIIAFILFSLCAYSGEVTFTGKARIIKDDVRSAMEASRINALLGGVSKYMRIALPDSDLNITEEYLMFVNNYTIDARWLAGSTVYTTVKININDLITEELAIYSAKQLNTVVFLFSGLPDYVPDGEVRKLIAGVLERNQFSTVHQAAFERDLIDPKSRLDIQAAFQSAMGAQYMLDFNFNLLEYAAGEYCRLLLDATYISSKNIDVITPVLRAELKIDDNDSNNCIAYAIETSLENAVEHLRKKFIPLPSEQMELLRNAVVFKNVTELKTINSITDTLVKRKILVTANIEEFFDDEAAYSVETYLAPQELAKQVEKQKFENIRELTPATDALEITIGVPDRLVPEERRGEEGL